MTTDELRDLQALVRGRLRMPHVTNEWARGILGVERMPMAEALTEDQANALLAAYNLCTVRTARRPEELVGRLSRDEIELLRGVTARGNFALRSGDGNTVNRLIDFGLLEKYGRGVRVTPLCAQTLTLAAPVAAGAGR